MCVFSQTGFSCGMRQDCTRRGCQTEVPAVRRESWCRVTGSNWQIALWFGGSGSSDIKLRLLLVYYSENPRSLKSRANGSLPLEWKSNSKAWVTQATSHNCFFLSFFFFSPLNSRGREILLGEGSPIKHSCCRAMFCVTPILGWLSSQCQSSGVQFNCTVESDSVPPHGLQHARSPCPPPTPRAYSNSCPLSRWCHPTISSSVPPSSPAFNLSRHQDCF